MEITINIPEWLIVIVLGWIIVIALGILILALKYSTFRTIKIIKILRRKYRTTWIIEGTSSSDHVLFVSREKFLSRKVAGEKLEEVQKFYAVYAGSSELRWEIKKSRGI